MLVNPEWPVSPVADKKIPDQLFEEANAVLEVEIIDLVVSIIVTFASYAREASMAFTYSIGSVHVRHTARSRLGVGVRVAGLIFAQEIGGNCPERISLNVHARLAEGSPACPGAKIDDAPPVTALSRPSALRVVFTLAMLAAMVSIRVRCAIKPLAPMSSVSNMPLAFTCTPSGDADRA